MNAPMKDAIPRKTSEFRNKKLPFLFRSFPITDYYFGCLNGLGNMRLRFPYLNSKNENENMHIVITGALYNFFSAFSIFLKSSSSKIVLIFSFSAISIKLITDKSIRVNHLMNKQKERKISLSLDMKNSKKRLFIYLISIPKMPEEYF